MRIVLIALLFSLAGCDWLPDDLIFSASEMRESEKIKQQIIWKKNKDGVDYFITCIEGYSFVVTKVRYYDMVLGGHVGRCDE